MRTNQTHKMEFNGQRLDTPVLGRSLEMNIKLIRNAMFITILILVISVVGKTSAHAAQSTRMLFEPVGITQIMFIR
jgi:hypothetical protein